MKNNSIYWKTSSDDNAKDILIALNDKYLIVQLVERKNSKVKVLRQFDSGMQYLNSEGRAKQIEWIDMNSLANMYQFYIIRSV